MKLVGKVDYMVEMEGLQKKPKFPCKYVKMFAFPPTDLYAEEVQDGEVEGDVPV